MDACRNELTLTQEDLRTTKPKSPNVTVASSVWRGGFGKGTAI
jgi:hypothetical protein